MQIDNFLTILMESASGAFSIFLGALVIIVTSNILLMPRLRTTASKSDKKVSLLVPARNEENVIARCVNSLLLQEYGNYELIVLDDNSTDGTGAILEELAAGHPKMRVIKGKPLPDGWLGKNWACMQLAEEATGDLLMFTDADTWHTVKSVSASVHLMDRTGAGLLSGIVRQQMDTFGEKLVVPLMLWGMICFTPVALMHNIKRLGMLTAACGQFMVFDRDAYYNVGGHSAVKARVDEDKEFARIMKKSGRNVIMADATNTISCKMYGGFRESVRGFSKNIFSAFNYKVLPFVAVWVAAVLCIVAPIAYLATVGYNTDPDLTTQALQLIALAFILWLLTYWKTKVPYYISLLYPVSMVLWFYVSMNSMVIAILGKQNWKSRNLPKPKVKLF